jgi:hypothetical protein
MRARLKGTDERSRRKENKNVAGEVKIIEKG